MANKPKPADCLSWIDVKQLAECAKEGFVLPVFNRNGHMDHAQWQSWNRLHNMGIGEIQGGPEPECFSINDVKLVVKRYDGKVTITKEDLVPEDHSLPDDGELITEAWVVSQYSERLPRVTSYRAYRLTEDPIGVGCEILFWEHGAVSVSVSNYALPHIKTRGQLRRLVEALTP